MAVPSLPRLRWIVLLTLLVVGGGGSAWAVCQASWQGDVVPAHQRVLELEERMKPRIEQWQHVRNELATIHERIREEYSDFPDPPDPIVLAALRNELERTTRRRQRMEAGLLDMLEEMLTLDPQHRATQSAKERVLVPLCDEVRLLVRYRDEHVRLLSYDEGERTLGYESAPQVWPTPATVRHRAEMTALETIEKELGQAFSALQRRFPNTEAVQSLDRKVVYDWHYKQLIRTLGRHLDPQDSPWREGGRPSAAGIEETRPVTIAESSTEEGQSVTLEVENVNRELLAHLERMKQLYPDSPFTRRAEQWIIQATAKRELTELQGWPIVILLAVVTLLIFGYIRCLTAYLRRRQEEEPVADSRIIRPASWTLHSPSPAGREPNPLNRPSTPPNLEEGRGKRR